MIAALIALIAANALTVLFFLRAAAAERRAVQLERITLAAERTALHAAGAKERAQLAQRIQAPEQAILEHAVGQDAMRDLPRAVSMFDDLDAQEATEALTREQYAEAAFNLELQGA